LCVHFLWKEEETVNVKPELEEVMNMIKVWKICLAAAVAAAALSLAGDTARALPGEEVRQLIEALEVGEPLYYENLTIIPVYAAGIDDHGGYTTLDEALARGRLEITELAGGTVPQVRMCNRSGDRIFIMGGEILTGGRQDRIVGRDVLLAPGARDIIVPVYCVEQGRWTYETEAFGSKANLGTPELRAEGQKADGESQTRIWSHVSAISDLAGSPSPTKRFQEAYETGEVSRKISEVRKRMEDIPRLCPDAIGAVIGVGNHITSVDIFSNPQMFRRLWPKILRSSALALVWEHRWGTLTQADAIGFLRRLHDRTYVSKPAISLGFELTAIDSEVNVNALVYGGAVIHLAGFPEDPAGCPGRRPENNDRRIPVMRR
jgi:hypothetical protein